VRSWGGEVVVVPYRPTPHGATSMVLPHT
jgi:hypothetical protein